jgi:hypothetical protein
MRRRDALKGLLGLFGLGAIPGPAKAARVVVRGRFARSTARLVPAWTAEEQRAWGRPA